MPTRDDALHARPPRWAERRGRIRRRWLVPFHRMEWAFEWLNYGISQWAFVRFLEQVAKFTVLVGIIYWIATAGDRTRERHYQAWQTISAAQGKSGDLGRSIALRDLTAGGVGLRGVNLAKSFLPGLELRDVAMSWVVFDSATCTGCDFSGSGMSLGRFRAAWMDDTGFRETSLSQADFLDAQVVNGDFRRAWAPAARFTRALLSQSTFRGAVLAYALFDSAAVAGVDFTGADLRGASLRNLRDWREIRFLHGANLHGVLDPPEGFLVWATDTMGAVVAESVEEWRRQVGTLHPDETWNRLAARPVAPFWGEGRSRAWWEGVDEQEAAGLGEGRW